MAPFGALVDDEATNAAVGWGLIGLTALAAVRTAIATDPLWGAFGALIAAVAALPAAVRRDPSQMVPWPLLAVAAGGVGLRALDLYPEVAGYVALAALALVAVAELDAFTAVEMSRRFAVGFAVLTTLAVQGVWTVVQFYADLWLGTDYLTTQVELQRDIVAVTVVALTVGGLFSWYVGRFEPPGSHAFRGGAADR